MDMMFFDSLIIDLKSIMHDETIKNKLARRFKLEKRVIDYVNSMTFYENAPLVSGYFVTLNGHYIKLYLTMGESQTVYELVKEISSECRNPSKENSSRS